MKWHNGQRDGNVEVDCLGLRAPLNSPEGAALRACQLEIQDIRDHMAKALIQTKGVGLMEPGKRQEIVKHAVDYDIGRELREFVHDKNNRSELQKWFDGVTGNDTPQARLNQFKQNLRDEFLHFPELYLSIGH